MVGAVVEILVGEVPHRPAVRVEPVHPPAVGSQPLPVEVGPAVVLDADARLRVRQVQAEGRGAAVATDPHLGFRYRQPAVDEDQAQLALLLAFRPRIRPG